MLNARFKLFRHKTIAITGALLLLWNGAVWLLSDNFYLSRARALIQQENTLAQERANDLTDSIQRNLNYLHGVPKMFSELLRVKWAVKRFGTSDTPSPLSKGDRIKKWASDPALLNLSQYLSFAATSLNVDLIYVVNAAGDAIASSNWESDKNVIGINVAERMLFKLNQQGLSGMQYAMGKATKIPGLFFSTPVFIDGEFYGAVVAKADLPSLSFLIKQMNAFVVDSNGVIILARDQTLEFNALAGGNISSMSSQARLDLYHRDNFPVLQIAPWPDADFPALFQIQNDSMPHLLITKHLPAYHLTVYVDSEVAALPALSRDYFWFTLLVAALGSVVILIISGTLHYFRSIKSSRELLWTQANFDSLTRLPNRDLLRDRLHQEIRMTNRTNLPFALMLIDLDMFKEVNDTLGHDMGDILLTQAAKRISDCVRKSDTVARLGGDEFIVMLPQLAKTYHAEGIAQKIISTLTDPFQLRNETAHISASIGITFYPNDAKTIDDLMKNADQAMYVSKKNGRNRFSYFTPSLQEEARNRQSLIRDLRGALAAKQLMVYFQPIVDLRTGQVHKAEALLRWKHPQRGMVSPAVFIPLAEESSLILEIAVWLHGEAAHWCKRWNEVCKQPFQISINRSPVEFMDDSGVAGIDRFVESMRAHNLSGRNFLFEITEGTLLNLSSNVSKELIALRDAGIQVALDDFGTGYSSLSYLKKLDIDYLKIDRAFVSNLEHESEDLVLCEAIISMAHKLGLKVVAEGVETAEQRDLLKNVHCDYAQGFYFTKPIPPEELEEWMKALNREQNE